jgi:hypothetical protein
MKIHEIRPGRQMPPLHLPVTVWRADGTREAAVLDGKLLVGSLCRLEFQEKRLGNANVIRD